MATVVTLKDQNRTQAQVDAERAFARTIRLGDVLAPDPLWNRTERTRKLGVRCAVIGVQTAQSQTGVMVTVRGWNGPVTLDAGWFREVQRAGGR